MTLRPLLLAISTMACVLNYGCPKEAEVQPKVAESPKLKSFLSRRDIVLVKHFYPGGIVSETQDPKYKALVPGHASITGVWLYEPGKEVQGQKGARFDLMETYFCGS